MHVRDWVRELSPPGLSPGRTEWRSVAGEAHAPLVAAAYLRDESSRFLVAVPSHERALQWQARLALCGVPASAIRHLPSGHSTLYDDAPPEMNALSERAGSLLALAESQQCIVIATPQAALERTLPLEEFKRLVVKLKLEAEIDPDQILKRLVAIGYEHEEPVRRPATFSRRGGIIDIFPAGAEFPFRLELFGDFIESLRVFDPETQRSIHDAKQLVLAPARSEPAQADHKLIAGLRKMLEEQASELGGEPAHKLRENIEGDLAPLGSGVLFNRLDLYLPHLVSEQSCALDYADGAFVFLDEPLELDAQTERTRDDLEGLLSTRHSSGDILKQTAGDYLLPTQGLIQSGNTVTLSATGAMPAWAKTERHEDIEITSLAGYRGRSEALAQAITNWRDQGLAIFIATDQPTRAKHVLANIDIVISAEPKTRGMTGETPAATMMAGNLAGGFIWPDEKIALLTDAELFGVGRLRLPQRRFREGAPISTVLDLKPGDYVVHIQFGIGIYRGLVRREVEGQEREFLHIEYKPPDKLLVPTDQLDRIQKYLSPGEGSPTIHRLTGGEWGRAVKSAKKGAEDLARELIAIYARRSQVSRHPFGEDSPWQGEMEATFPYIETPSQLKAINDVKRDLNRPHPTDRLVIGDVGFGKTEVAVRAAFKVAQEGRQVAVLCPTTILADQHFETFRERLSPYPVQVHLLNRFRSAKQKRETLDGLKDGSVDIVIGTHALLQKGVEYKNLGLVIVDEEQRFGVKHKEHLKKLRASVDFLTLTATPIPRTLSMALMNIRQMSVITDPPPGRLPIRTYLRPYADELVRDALLRELARGGQVFYVFNRVEGIEHVAEKVRKLTPNARVAVAHGQMHADELEPIMMAFFHNEVDILVCTTIIENGIDNPNANTLIVDGADRLGLAQLYQLRGRVGRSDRQAYAYLLYRSGKRLTDTAVARLKALQEFTDLGSGYGLAFRDLQIRGAGELLGGKQHGLMQTVGYELYTQLINDAVKKLKMTFDEGGEAAARMAPLELEAGVEFHPLPAFDLPAGAYLPKSYIKDESQRLFYYKKLMEARDEEAIAEVEDELRDRYGALPGPAQAAAKLMRLRLLAQELGIEKLDGRFGKMTATLRKGREMPLRAVHALGRRAKDLRFRPDRVEWRYGNDPLTDAEAFLDAIRSEIEEAKAARAAART